MSKTETIQEWKEKLGSDPRWALRGLTRIYQFQTDQEKRINETVVENGVGFSGVDANILSSFALQLEMGRRLSKKQMEIVFKKMPKYAGQLFEISREEREKKERTQKALQLCKVSHT